MKSKILMLLMLCLALNIEAQTNLVATYQELMTNFTQKQNIAFQVKYEIFKTHQAITPQQKVEMEVIKEVEGNYMKFEGFEILQQGEQYLQIDHLNQTLYLQNNKQGELPTLNMDDFGNWAAMLDLEGQTDLSDDGQTFLRLYSTTSKMSMEVTYDAATKLIYKSLALIDLSNLEGIAYEYDQKKVAVQFSNYQTKGVKLPLRIDQVLQQKGEKLIGVGKYQSYELVIVE